MKIPCVAACIIMSSTLLTQMTILRQCTWEFGVIMKLMQLEKGITVEGITMGTDRDKTNARNPCIYL
jgi:hypothetical protein